jgi:hypothetical protein
MANLRTDRPADARGDSGWGTADDVKRADERLAAEEKHAADVLKRLLGRQQTGDPQTGDHDRRPHITPWLLIRYNATDLGYRPIPPNQTFWESPDIWVESSDPLARPVAGQSNFVHARIWNLGAFDAAPVKTDFYWADPSVGLDAAHMHLIGSEYVEVKSLQSVDVRCNTPWVPVLVNSGHECLMVNSSNWIGDPILQPFQPVQDRHVGQRNVHVIVGPPGMMVTTLLNLANLSAAAMQVELLATIAHMTPLHALRREGDFHFQDQLARALAFDASHEGAFAHVRRTFDKPFLEVQFAGASRFYDLSAGRVGEARAAATAMKAMALPREPRSETALARPSLRLAEAALRPGEVTPLQLRVAIPAAAKPGEVIVCRLYQIAQHQVVGGYTVVVMVADR